MELCLEGVATLEGSRGSFTGGRGVAFRGDGGKSPARDEGGASKSASEDFASEAGSSISQVSSRRGPGVLDAGAALAFFDFALGRVFGADSPPSLTATSGADLDIDVP